MLNTVANVLLFIVLVIGVWTIVCMVAKMPWVYDLFSKVPYKQVKLEVWVAVDGDGFIGVFSSKPHRTYENSAEWQTDEPKDFILCANDRLAPFANTIDLSWKDEPLKATLTIDVTATDFEKAKIHEIDLMYGKRSTTAD